MPRVYPHPAPQRAATVRERTDLSHPPARPLARRRGAPTGDRSLTFAARRREGVGRRGFALLAVLVVSMMTAMIVVSLMFTLRAEQASHTAGRSNEQARAVAMSGLAQAIQIVDGNAHASEIWRDNPDSFQNQMVLDDGANRWYFSVYAPPGADGEGHRFGLTDEASRLNLHRTQVEPLAALPGLSTAIAEDILTFLGVDTGGTSDATADDADPADPADDLFAEDFDDLDEDAPGFEELLQQAGEDEDPDGAFADEEDLDAEADHDFSLFDDEPSTATVGEPNLQGMVTLDHLLALNDIDIHTLYGGNADEETADAAPRSISSANLPAFNAQRLETRGLRDFATLLSHERNVDIQGNPRVDITDPDADLDALDLPDVLLEAIEQLHESDRQIDHVAQLLIDAPADDEDDGDENGDENADNEDEDDTGFSLASTGSDSVEDASAELEGTLAAELEPQQIRDWLDRATATSEQMLQGLVNINTAPAEVLAALPGIDEALAEMITARRGSLDPEDRESIAWLWEEELLSFESFVELAPRITTRSYQFHVQVFAYAMPSRQYRVIEAVIDIAGDQPRVIYMRDLTRLGPPLPMEDNGGSSSGALARSVR